ncbi:GTPase ObgE [Metamycoplasma hyosynoviae]|nr:GTPase ObgE [Metamycoplasma hyosynoviae]MDC8917994.1 GTPase ObgE [Metamycoplasma hyosynoviae]MDC8937540.1 GTPase ObgE [Metamycoplasma hyosynoviae]
MSLKWTSAIYKNFKIREIMKFIDEVFITVYAGNGGNGIISFRREAHVDKGGPDGGDGGNGGNIIFQGDKGMNTLLSFHYQNKYKAQSGENGKPKNAYGANAEDLVVKVPLGTSVFHNGKLIADVITEDKYLIARGGIGGKGNNKFKSSKNTAPRICENGTLGEIKDLKLSLKVLADVGLVGKPSAGKSTLLSKISNAKPKIADYDFTTLVPQLGIVKYYENSYVVADLPGLIEDASKGKGLGIRFLKHIERCKIIAHIIDFGSDIKDPINDFEIINNELKRYNLRLENLPQIVIANKADLPSFNKNLKAFKEKYPKQKIIKCSALTEQNIDKVIEEIYKLFTKVNKNLKDIQKENNETEVITITLDKDELKITKLDDKHFEIISNKVYDVYRKIPLISIDNLWRLNAKLENMGIFAMLREKGIKKGDFVKILDYEFEWKDDF